ncbi:hypothetical protein Ddc_15897 [Ditylenchus destructor]|nr:hypothetical protein Ddc_15897 [Ditylenchus destructor]
MFGLKLVAIFLISVLLFQTISISEAKSKHSRNPDMGCKLKKGYCADKRVGKCPGLLKWFHGSDLCGGDKNRQCCY